MQTERMTETKTDPAPRPPPELVTLRKGSRGELVGLVQNFLRGRDLYHGQVDEDFGPGTEKAVRDFQKSAALDDDGVVGNRTWGALMSRGLVVLPSDSHTDDKRGANWPPPPASMKPFTSAQRAATFGAIEVVHDPQPANPENVRIVSRGPEYRIVDVDVPELRPIFGFAPSGRVLLHAKVERPFRLLIKAWKDEGLLERLRSWGGALSVRYIRGSRSVLSAHAWGSAFDINVGSNPLGSEPALVGKTGSVRELVPIANELGWYWGGHFTRMDGMHFEVARVM